MYPPKTFVEGSCVYEGDILVLDSKQRVCTIPLSAPVSQGESVIPPTSPSYIPLCDTHTHIHCLSSQDAVSALARAALGGIGMLINPIDPVEDMQGSTFLDGDIGAWIQNLTSCARTLADLSYKRIEHTPYQPMLFDHTYALVGVHPYNAASLEYEMKEKMRRLVEDPYVRGIGEIGIDLGPYNTCPITEQIDALTWQLELAHDMDMPVELHIRDANDDASYTAHAYAREVLEHVGIPARGCILHCFTSTLEVMQPFVDMGATIAFGGVSTFASAEYVRHALVACPLMQMVVETDAPYMAPSPLRGLECEPLYVAYTARALADTLMDVHTGDNYTEQNIYRALWNNSANLFAPDLCI